MPNFLEVSDCTILIVSQLTIQKNYYRASNELMWCVLSEEELRKCEAFAAATADDQMKTNEQAFGSYYRKVKNSI